MEQSRRQDPGKDLVLISSTTPLPSHLPASLLELGEFLDPMEGTLSGAEAGRQRVVQRMEGSPEQV